LNVAVIGAGAFGKNHLRIYGDIESATADLADPVKLVAIVESDSHRASALRNEQQIPVYGSIEECLASALPLHAASVCVPTSHHFGVAAKLLTAGLDLLVEKPISATVDEADELIRIAQKHQRILQVGHLERFNPAIVAIQPHINRPMFFEAHRLSVFTPRALDVDVVLDLMIHDLDIVLTLAQSPVREIRAVGLPILSPKVDIANVRIEFESGCVANFTASRVSTERIRKLRFFQPRQYVSIDYARKDLLIVNVDNTKDFQPSTLAPGLSGLSFSKPVVTPGEPLRLEIESFLDAVRTRAIPRVSAQDGRNALALALEINNAIVAHSKRAGLDKFHL
jgi:predicted dehydrogenase